MAERGVRGGGVGAPGCESGVVNGECTPARGRRKQIAEGFAPGAALRDPQSPAGLQEQKGMDPPGGWVTVCGTTATSSRPRAR
jgi:hypothetical protein